MQNCKPFGVKIQYGQHLIDINSKHKITISFNTPDPCTHSFLRVLSATGFQQINCQSNTITTSPNMQGFIAYVQKCDIYDELSFDRPFEYVAYGWEEGSSTGPVASELGYVEVEVVDPRKAEEKLNVLILADWGPAYDTGFTYIQPTLKKVMT